MNDLFEGISVKEKWELLRIFDTFSVTVNKGFSVLSTNRQEVIFGIISEGSLQIIKEDYNGNKRVIESLYENTLFSSLFLPYKDTEYNIIANENSKVLLFNFKEILNPPFEIRKKISDAYDTFIKNLLKFMSNEILTLNERIDILTNKTIRDKLLAYFKIKRNHTGSNIIYLEYSFTLLAEYLGVDRSAMNRELKHLKDEGLIEITGKKIKLLFHIQ